MELVMEQVLDMEQVSDMEKVLDIQDMLQDIQLDMDTTVILLVLWLSILQLQLVWDMLAMLHLTLLVMAMLVLLT